MPSPTGSRILSSLCRVRDWTKVVPQMQEQVDAEWFHSSLKHTHSKFCQEHTQHLRERCLQSAISSTCGKLAPPMIWVCDCHWDWMCQYKASQWKHHPSCSHHVGHSFKRQWIWLTGNWRLALAERELPMYGIEPERPGLCTGERVLQVVVWRLRVSHKELTCVFVHLGYHKLWLITEQL